MATQEKAGINSADGQEKPSMALLQKSVSDMLAVEEDISSAAKRQVKNEELTKHASQASRVINNIAQMSKRHEQELQALLQSIGGDSAKGIMEITTAALGSVAGFYDKIRSEAIAEMVRGDYTALNLATIGYTMLHTTALALNEQKTASVALRHLQEYTSVVLEINEIVPSVIIADLRQHGARIDDKVLLQAVANTQSTWQRHNSDQGTATSSHPGNGAPIAKPRATTKKPANGASTASKTTSTTPKAEASEKTSGSKAATTTSKPAPKKPAATTSKASSSASKGSADAANEKSSAASN